MQAHEETFVADARYIVRWIERHERREFSKREAYQHCKRRFPRADDIDPALKELERRGYIRTRPIDGSGPGRPPSPVFEVNPAIFENGNAETRPQYSQNPLADPRNPNSGNIGGASGQSQNAKRKKVTI